MGDLALAYAFVRRGRRRRRSTGTALQMIHMGGEAGETMPAAAVDAAVDADSDSATAGSSAGSSAARTLRSVQMVEEGEEAEAEAVVAEELATEDAVRCASPVAWR
eukprot:PLAT6756.1.p4 GENE.PLAT6756.1~~PLAT6756.1.p4  ORF type:complete len:106 (+),score=43.16 PLAT6756.1:361-678(+)